MTIDDPVTDERDSLAVRVSAALTTRAGDAGVPVTEYMAGILDGQYPPITAEELSRQRVKRVGDWEGGEPRSGMYRGPGSLSS